MFVPDLETDFENFKHFLSSRNIPFDIPKAEDGTDCKLIYLGGTAVAGAQLIVIKFYEDGEFQGFVAYPDSEYHPTNNWRKDQIMDTLEEITVLQEPHCDYKRVLAERAAKELTQSSISKTTDELVELEKQLFTVGIDIKFDKNNMYDNLKRLTQLLIGIQRQNERILNQPTNHTRLNNAEIDRLNERLVIAGCGFAELDGFNAVQHVYDLVDHLCKVNTEYQTLMNKCRELSDFVKQLDTEPILDTEDDDFDEPTD